MGLILFTGNVGATSLRERVCSGFFRIFPRYSREQLLRTQDPIALIKVRYAQVRRTTPLHWDESIGLLRAKFAPNLRRQNATMFDFVSGLALALNGTEYPDRRRFDPRKPTRPTAEFRLVVNMSRPTYPDNLVEEVRVRPRFGQGPVPTSPPPREMTAKDYEYDKLEPLLNWADRTSLVDNLTEVHWLELRTSPEALRALRAELKKIDRTFGRACSWPRALVNAPRISRACIRSVRSRWGRDAKP